MRGRTARRPAFRANASMGGMTMRSFASRLGRGRSASAAQRSGARSMM